MVSRLLIVLGLALSTLGEARFLPLRHSSPHYEAHREYHRGHLARIQGELLLGPAMFGKR